MWPSFFMLPEPNSYGGWCSSGEVVVMSHTNVDGGVVGSAIFGGSAAGDYLSCISQGGSAGS